MQAVILAGGRGERLRPLTDTIPKPMIKIEEKPFLQYQLELLARYDITTIVLCVGYLKDKIVDYFGNGSQYGVDIVYSSEERPLGTGGALKKAQQYFEESFLLLNGDTYVPIDYPDLLAFFLNRQMERVMGVMVFYSNKESIASSNAQISVDSRILSYSKNSSSGNFNAVDAGVYVFNREVIGLFPERKVFSLEEEVFPKMIRMGTLIGYEIDTCFYDIGTAQRLELFRDLIRGPNRERKIR